MVAKLSTLVAATLLALASGTLPTLATPPPIKHDVLICDTTGRSTTCTLQDKGETTVTETACRDNCNCVSGEIACPRYVYCTQEQVLAFCSTAAGAGCYWGQIVSDP
ncbi:hypothetical protein BJ170DRAFT_680813 [Xylariales sp. AK1849]|nr:hypothetical protein BJ170DRAFT_680813 [Xylariales sp. AK1849]